MKLSSSVKLACLGLATVLTASSFAAGFQLTQMGAKKLGQANAGAAAYGDEASTIFWNPAGLTKLDEQQLMFGASIIDIGASFEPTIAVDAIGQPLQGTDGSDIGGTSPVPTVFYARPGERFSWGLGIHAPYGSSTDYDDNSIFRFQADKTEITGIDINPAFAWQASDKLSLGLGVDIQYFKVNLTSQVDYAVACFGAAQAAGAAAPAIMSGVCSQIPGAVALHPITMAPIPAAQAVTGRSEVEGDSWAFGWNVGLMYDLTDNFTIGLSHRSSVDHDLEGDASFTDAPAILVGATGLFADSDIEAPFESPALTSLSAKWDVNPYWTIAADASHSTWSNFEELNIDYITSTQPNTVEAFNWDDVMRYSLGVEHHYSDQWSFRTGVAYDQSPIDEAVRGPRLPSSNRTWVSVGGTYNYSDRTSFDLAYVKIFIDTPIAYNRTGTFNDTIVGSYDADSSILAFQMTHKF